MKLLPWLERVDATLVDKELRDRAVAMGVTQEKTSDENIQQEEPDETEPHLEAPAIVPSPSLLQPKPQPVKSKKKVILVGKNAILVPGLI